MLGLNGFERFGKWLLASRGYFYPPYKAKMNKTCFANCVPKASNLVPELQFKISIIKEARRQRSRINTKSTTLDTEHHMGKVQKHKNNHIQESQEVSAFPADDHKASMNRQESITNTNHK